MALGSKNRDYKTSARQIQAQLNIHQRRINELVAGGMGPFAASTVAYDEVRHGVHKDAINAEVERLKKLRGGKGEATNGQA